MAKINGLGAKVIIRNKLTQKPQQGANRLEKFIKSQELYDVSVRQDYSKQKVELQLLTRSYKQTYEPQEPVQTRYVPITSASKAYTKTAKEMIQAQKESYNKDERFVSQITRIMRVLGL